MSHNGTLFLDQLPQFPRNTTKLNVIGATPFLLAARTADPDLMRLLVELGADPLRPNEDGTTPLMLAEQASVQVPQAKMPA